jgi:hypothetical protein
VELAEVAWEGREVILTPASTITTNQKKVWDHFRLADLLRRRGATVTSLLLPPLEGRRRTFSQAGEAEVEVVEPPRNAGEALRAAKAAGRRAQEVRPYRLSLPRKKPSKQLERAISWLERTKAERLDGETLKRAKRCGLKVDTVRKAMTALRSRGKPSL